MNTSSWSEEDLKNPAKLYEKTVLLNAQREIADKILDAQWEAKWRQEKVNQGTFFTQFGIHITFTTQYIPFYLYDL